MRAERAVPLLQRAACSCCQSARQFPQLLFNPRGRQKHAQDFARSSVSEPDCFQQKEILPTGYDVARGVKPWVKQDAQSSERGVKSQSQFKTRCCKRACRFQHCSVQELGSSVSFSLPIFRSLLCCLFSRRDPYTNAVLLNIARLLPALLACCKASSRFILKPF